MMDKIILEWYMEIKRRIKDKKHVKINEWKWNYSKKKKKKSTLTDWALKNVFTVKLNAAISQDCTKNVARSHKWSG